MSVEAPPLLIGPNSNGIRLEPEEFDAADFETGWRYELIRGVLIVSPAPLEEERDPNEELGYLLRSYKDNHPNGHNLNKTLAEQDVRIGPNRRRADRAIWAGLGRRPKRRETPTVVVEFVSEGKRNRKRDYEDKRDEYLGLEVQEYWIIDRFERTMTAHIKRNGDYTTTVICADESYSTPLLPGFEVPLSRLFDLSDDWED